VKRIYSLFHALVNDYDQKKGSTAKLFSLDLGACGSSPKQGPGYTPAALFYISQNENY
jgi:hypothetical protein